MFGFENINTNTWLCQFWSWNGPRSDHISIALIESSAHILLIKFLRNITGETEDSRTGLWKVQVKVTYRILHCYAETKRVLKTWRGYITGWKPPWKIPIWNMLSIKNNSCSNGVSTYWMCVLWVCVSVRERGKVCVNWVCGDTPSRMEGDFSLQKNDE